MGEGGEGKGVKRIWRRKRHANPIRGFALSVGAFFLRDKTSAQRLGKLRHNKWLYFGKGAEKWDCGVGGGGVGGFWV